jgi:MFS transporter, YNFM family, putative membrane transport protein
MKRRAGPDTLATMRWDKRALGVAFAAIGAFIELYTTQALLPLLAHEFAASPAQVSRTVSASTFAVALIAPFTGAVADMLGRKRVIVSALFLLVVPTAMAAFAQSLDALVFWRFVQGLLLPPIFAVTVAYIGEEFPDEATSMTGLYVAASGIGGFLSRFLSALLAQNFGWRASFLGLAVVTLACAAGCALLMPHERRFQKSGGLVRSLRLAGGHLRNPELLAAYAVGFGVLFSFVGAFTYVNFLLAAPPYRLSTAALGTIFVVYLVGVATTPLSGVIVARIGRRLLVALAGLLWIGGLAVTLAPGLPAILLGLATCVACGFMCQSCATSYVAVTARQARSSAVGLYVTFYYLGGGLGAVAPGYAWAAAGWPGCVACIIVVVALVIATALGFWREPGQRPPDTLSTAPDT